MSVLHVNAHAQRGRPLPRSWDRDQGAGILTEMRSPPRSPAACLVALVATAACSGSPPPAPVVVPSSAPSAPAMSASPAPDVPPRCPEGAHLAELDPVNDGGGPQHRAWCTSDGGVAEGGFWHTLSSVGPTRMRIGRFHEGRPVGTWVEILAGDGCGIATADVACSARPRLAEQSYDEQGRLHGASRRWTETGQILLDESFVHGVRIGRYRTWHTNGRPHQDGTFAAGEPLPADLHLADMPSPSLLASGPPGPRTIPAAWVRDGEHVPVGLWQTWLEDGSVASTRSFDAQGHPEGRFCEAGTCSVVTVGTGTLVLPYADGARGGEVHFSLRAHALHGVFEEWKRIYEDERRHLVARRRYQDGRLDGAAEEWDERGQLILRQTYREGVLEGPSFERRSDDAWGPDVVVTGWYCQGHRCGTWILTSASRKRSEETYDSSGQQTGEWLWDEQGALRSHWTKAEMAYYERGSLPPDVRRWKHAECLRQLVRGDCCEADSDPPPQATVCNNKPPPPQRRRP